MLNFICILSLSVLVLNQSRASPAQEIPGCSFDGSYPNDTVFCKEYLDNLTCTNAKECCKNPSINGCFNMSVIQAYGMWAPPNPDPKENVPSCSRKEFVISRDNNTDKAIDGHVLERFKVLTLTQCGDFCLRLPRCRAFNLATVIELDGTKDCELLEDDTKVVDKQGFSFWFFDRDLYTEAYLEPLCDPE